MLRTLYSPLTKAEENDDGTLTVEGIASAETVDATGETVLASAMEAALPDFFAFGTGNLREMHQLSAAGTVDVAEVTEEGETRISATVVDPVAIIKIKAGVYRGFSIGGKVLGRDPKDKKVITKIRLVEISLVDRPCCPDAKIEVWKAESEGDDMDPKNEGAAAPTPETAETTAIAASAPVADPVIETAKAETVKAEAVTSPAAEPATPVVEAAKADAAPEAGKDAPAVPAAADGAPGAAEAAPEAEPTAKAAPTDGGVAPAAPAPLDRAMAALDALDAAVKAAGGEDLGKSLYSVRTFADVLSSIAYMVSDLKSEAEFEGDNSPVPAKLQAWLHAGVPLFKEMAAEEIDELVARVTAQKAEGAAAITKGVEETALTKAQALVAAETDALKGQVAEREAALSKLADRVEPLVATVEALSKRLTAIEDQPAPPKTVAALAKATAVPVSKEQDSAGGGAAEAPAVTGEALAKAFLELSDEDRTLLVTKAALSRPIIHQR